MPTEKPRISITLDAADVAVLDRFAAAAGQPRASFLASMIAAAIPEFQRAAEVMELAKEAPAGVVRGVVDAMSSATDDAMGVLVQAVDQSRAAIVKAQGKPKTARREGAAGVGTRLRGGAAAAPAPKRRTPPSDPRLLTGGSK